MSDTTNTSSIKIKARLLTCITSLLVLTFGSLIACASPSNYEKAKSPELYASSDVCNPERRQLECKNHIFRGDWSGINFANADLQGSIFWEGSIFYGADFSNAKMSGADFRSSRQRSAPTGGDDPDYSVCTNGGCPSPVDLRSANFSNAELDGVYFGGALVSGANFDGAWLPEASFFPTGNTALLDMKGASFRGAYMEDASFYKVNLARVDFKKARLSGATFLKSNLALTQFVNSMLERSSFIDSVIRQTNFKDTYGSKIRLPSGCKKLNGPTTC